MWWQDDGSWWEDQSWLETSQVWNGSWDESWDYAWNEGPESWDESWSWPAIEDQQPNAGAASSTQGVQSLVLSPLISEVFASVTTGLMFETDSSNESETVCSQFLCDETVFHVSVAGLQCLESNRLFCNCETCMIVSDDFGANLECCQLRNVRLNHFLTVYHQHVLFSPLNFTKSPNSFLFLTVSLHVQSLWASPQTLEMNLMTAVMMKRKQTCANVEFGFWMGA